MLKKLVFICIFITMNADLAGATEVILHGTTADGDILNRPATDGRYNYPNSISYPADAAPYAINAFYTDISGHFDIASYASNKVGVQGDWDNFFGLYEISFDPLAPLKNLVFFNDDIFINAIRAAGNQSTFESKANVQYFAVTTGVNGASGIYTLLLGSQGNIWAGHINSAIPEPRIWGILLIGFGAVGVRMRTSGSRTIA